MNSQSPDAQASAHIKEGPAQPQQSTYPFLSELSSGLMVKEIGQVEAMSSKASRLVHASQALPGGASVIVSAHQLALLGVAQVATEEMLAAAVGMRSVEQIKDNIIRCAYWHDFMAAARAGCVPDGWLQGVLGKVVLGWAKNGAHGGE